MVEDDGVVRSSGLAPNVRKAVLQGNVRVRASPFNELRNDF